MKIEKDVLNVLSRSTTEGHILYLPQGQLDRSLYVAVNKCLECIGGKWDRKSKGHVFSSDPSDLLDEMINTGEVTDAKKEFQFFETPQDIAIQMVKRMNIEDSDVLLEPSAGKGAILKNFPSLNRSYAVELNPENASFLNENFPNVHVFARDFLDPSLYSDSSFPVGFDKIIMNPPFSKHQDIKHIFQAWDILNKDGMLISVVSESPFFREDKLSKEFMNLLNSNDVRVTDLEPGAFKESGTMVKARIVQLYKR
jgi:predicted RNA methylase